MTNDYLKSKMLKFLENHYPVSRVKYENRFKRGIVLDGGEVFILNDDFSYLQLQIKLFDILTLVFDTDEKTTLDVLIAFLHLKTKKNKTS